MDGCLGGGWQLVPLSGWLFGRGVAAGAIEWMVVWEGGGSWFH